MSIVSSVGLWFGLRMYEIDFGMLKPSFCCLSAKFTRVYWDILEYSGFLNFLETQEHSSVLEEHSSILRNEEHSSMWKYTRVFC